jgi:hypothetical protein
MFVCFLELVVYVIFLSSNLEAEFVLYLLVLAVVLVLYWINSQSFCRGLY